MKDLKEITGFFFGKAEYFISDSHGNEILMKVFYKDNYFQLEVIKKFDKNILLLTNESEKVALDLLKRKHNVNFAKLI